MIGTLALILCAWFALGIHQSHDLEAATKIIDHPPLTRAQSQHADALLSSAATLNPDRSVDIERGYLAMDGNNLPGARRVLLKLVKSEPQNLEAWYALAQSSAGAPRVSNLAYGTLARLRPKVH